jgi:hypothetical protein
MRRRKLLVLSASLMMGFICAMITMYIDQARAHKFQVFFGRIHDGMTQREVEAVLNCSPGNYQKVPHQVLFTYGGGGPHDMTVRSEDWSDDDGTLEVTFDRNGVVVGKEFRPAAPALTMTERIERWLRP